MHAKVFRGKVSDFQIVQVKLYTHTNRKKIGGIFATLFFQLFYMFQNFHNKKVRKKDL